MYSSQLDDLSFYAIVFDDDCVAHVPSNWLNIEEKSCFWPVKANKNIDDLVKNKTEPLGPSWRVFGVKHIDGKARSKNNLKIHKSLFFYKITFVHKTVSIHHTI